MRRSKAQDIHLLGWISGSPFLIIAGTYLGAVIASNSYGQDSEAIGAVIGALFAFLITILELIGFLRSEKKTNQVS